MLLQMRAGSADDTWTTELERVSGILEMVGTASNGTLVGREPISRARFRPDIEGLRAVAVLFVVAHHIGLAGFESGFIGVDVFFVLSGFLITTKLLIEITETGRIDLAAFWAGRVRRLLPIAATVIAVTLIVALVLTNPLEWRGLVEQARAGALFVANQHFAAADTGYFAESTRDSPFLHLWSLAVEEQFYVVLPLLLAGALRLRSNRNSLELPLLTVAAVTIGSLVTAAFLTSSGSPHAYYSLASRGWELGAGALLAFGWSWVEQHRSRVRPVCTGGGLVLLVVGLAVIDVSAFPAWGAVFPVVGALLIVIGEPTGPLADRTLGSPPMRAMGRWSYGWYLWHWPAIVLGTLVLGDSLAVKTALAAASLALAAATYRFVEQPVRHSGLPTRPSLRLGVALLISLLVVVQLGQVRGALFFADDTHARIAAARDDHLAIEGACTGVDADVLALACSTGDVSGARPVLLYGDSHMTHWRPALEPAAAQVGMPTVRSILGNCFALGEAHTVTTPECVERATGLPSLLEDLRPSAVVVSFSATYGDLRSDGSTAEDQMAAWTRTVEDLASQLRAAHVPLLVLLDTPRYGEDPLECMTSHDDWSECALRTEDVQRRNRDVNDAILLGLERAGHGTSFDPIPLLCPGSTCLLDVDGYVVPQDTHHLTRGFVARQQGIFVDLLTSLTKTSSI